MKKLMILASVLFFFTVACDKKKDAQPEPITNSNNNTSGTFTPPTNNYYIIDDKLNAPSADAFQCANSGGIVSVVKSFDSINVVSSSFRIEFPQAGSSTPRDIESIINEGNYRTFNIDSVGKADDQAQIFLEFQYGGEYYYLQGKGGKIYVNRKNGILRYTTDGVLSVNGPKWVGSGFSGNFYRNVKFSAECGSQF